MTAWEQIERCAKGQPAAQGQALTAVLEALRRVDAALPSSPHVGHPLIMVGDADGGRAQNLSLWTGSVHRLVLELKEDR